MYRNVECSQRDRSVYPPPVVLSLIMIFFFPGKSPAGESMSLPMCCQNICPPLPNRYSVCAKSRLSLHHDPKHIDREIKVRGERLSVDEPEGKLSLLVDPKSKYSRRECCTGFKLCSSLFSKRFESPDSSGSTHIYTSLSFRL